VCLEFESLAFPRKKVIQPAWILPILLFSERKTSLSQTLSPLFSELVTWQLDVEDLFCSKIRIKVLKLLFVYGQMTPSDIAERLKVNYKLALRHLELLEKEDVIEHRISGRIRYFRFKNSIKARATTDLLDVWKEANHQHCQSRCSEENCANLGSKSE
jgi:DNA-binding transcriptional ArsR family regulator